jgi:hypothetical protein
MRQIWLFLNGQAVDLPASTRGLVKFSQARSVLADVAARKGEFSFPFKLPATRRNAQVLGVDLLHPLALGKFGPGATYAYELRCEGQVLTGTAQLSSLKDGYTITLLGEGFSWATQLGDKKLTDLGLAPINYDGSQLEATLAKDCDATDVQFPLVAYGNFFTPPTVRTAADDSTEEVPVGPGAGLDYPLSVDDYPPGVYYGNILQQIFADIGWRLQSRELDSPFWRQVVMLPAGADLESAWPWGALLPASATGRGSVQHAYVDYNGETSDTAIGRQENADAGNLGGLDMAGDIFFLPVPVPGLVSAPTRALVGTTSAYTAPRNGTYGFKWAAALTSAEQLLQVNNYSYLNAQVGLCMGRLALAVVVLRGGQYSDHGLLAGAPEAQDVATFQYLNGANGIAPGTYSGAGSVYLEAGDVAQLCVVARTRLTDTPTSTDAITRERLELTFGACSFACTSYTDDDGLSKTQLRPADFLPGLSQRDVVRDFLQRIDGFILADGSRQVATVLSRSDLSRAGGEAIDLSQLCDVRSVEYLPAAGAGVGSFLFSPATNDDDPLTPAGADVVLAPIGKGDGQQSIGSQYAPVAFRTVYFAKFTAPLPTCSTKDILAQNRSEASWEVSSQPPRLLRYTGLSNTQRVPFMQGTVPLAKSAWDGPLAWDGVGGAVAIYYADTIRRAVVGHLARVQLPISPALYQALGPGRRALLFGASYTVEALTNWDAADEGALASIDLSREVL